MEPPASSASDIEFLPHTGPPRRRPLAEDGSSSESSPVDLRAQARHVLPCVVLHLVLVVGHVVLFGVYAGHFEHNITMDVNHFSTTWAPLILSTLLQTVGTVYLAVCAFVTQRLALTSALYTRQTLTAIHDKSAAWLGLGSAFVTLGLQTRLPSAFLPVLCITLYLLGNFALHISIPGLFHIVPYNATAYVPNPVKLAKADVGPLYSSEAYDVLTVYGRFPTLGLAENVVYDVLAAVPLGVGNTTLSAFAYEVDCSSLPQAAVVPGGGADASQLVFDLNDGQHTQVNITIPPGVSITAATSSVTDNIESAGSFDYGGAIVNWSPFFLSSSIPVVDSSGTIGGPWTSMGVEALYTWGERVGSVLVAYDRITVVPSVQLLACSVQVRDIDALTINVETRQPFASELPQPPSEVYWKNWTWPQPIPNATATDSRVLAGMDAPFFAPISSHLRDNDVYVLSGPNATLTGGAPTTVYQNTSNDTFWSLADTMNITTPTVVQPSVFDVFLMQDLQIGFWEDSTNRTNITLAELNASLGRALAALYWYNQTLDATDSTLNLTQKDTNAVTYVWISIERSRLNLSLTPLIVGTVVSLLLLLLSVMLARLPKSDGSDRPSTVVKSSGILQFTWLLGTEPRLHGIERPDLHELRRAGLFDVEVRERRTAYRGKGESEADEGDAPEQAV